MTSSAPVSRPPTSIFSLPNPDRIKAEQNISLVDHTKPASREHSAERAPSTTSATDQAATNQQSIEPLYKRLTHTSTGLQEGVRRQIAKQKYARYGKDRYTDADEPPLPTAATSTSTTTNDDDNNNADPAHPPSLRQQGSYLLSRGRAKAKTLWKRKRKLRAENHADTHLDILYENQRGSFLFGIPRFSASTLLPSDPRPWQNAAFRTSPVSILNAQPPDPSWEWVWKNWYVDMSRDVDEEGWEYSFMFRREFNWHGNHPWFHSFVRRRRWVRLRRRKDTRVQTREKGHELTSEYFTIHPKSLAAGTTGTGTVGRIQQEEEEEEEAEEDLEVEKMEVRDIGALATALRRARVDREKLLAVRKFVEGGGEELYYLAERIPAIMNGIMYQTSRRQLLGELLSCHDHAHRRQEELAAHDHAGDSKAADDHGLAVRTAENLHRAVVAAEEQVKRLEYWSDIKDMAREDQLLHPADFQHLSTSGPGHPEQSFASKQSATEPAPDLHSHPEHAGDAANVKRPPSTRSSRSASYDAATSPPARKSSGYLASAKGDEESEDDRVSRYTTATEGGDSDLEPGGRKPTSPAQRGREKAARLQSLDGLLDERAEHAGGQSGEASGGSSDRPVSPMPTLSGHGAGGADEVAVSAEEAGGADTEGRVRLLPLRPEAGVEEGDVVEEANA